MVFIYKIIALAIPNLIKLTYQKSSRALIVHWLAPKLPIIGYS